MATSLFNHRRIFKISATILLVIWYTFFLVTPVKFTISDLGRHLENGKVIISSITTGNLVQLQAVLHTNFYSYTHSDFPFINHHWGIGVIFYLIWTLVGFKGLSIFYIALSVITFLIFFFIAVRQTGWKITVPLAFFLIPLIAERVEVRPEGFSYFLAAIFFVLLTRYSQGRVRFRTLLIALPLLEIIWINCHIYFFFGLIIIAFFGAEKFFTQPDKWAQIKKFGGLFFLTATAGLLNPSGLSGLLYPLHIFQNYGISLTENLPGWLVVQQGIKFSNYPIFLITLVILFAGIIGIFLKKRRDIQFASLGFTVFLGFLAWQVVRSYTLFGLFALPALATLIYELKPNFSKYRPSSIKILAIMVVLATIGLTLWLNLARIKIHYLKSFGIGIAPNSLDAANFFNENAISGPIFSDYDIGGYAIYSFFPRERVFIDNRSEAFPASWIWNTFIPMHTSFSLWQQQEAKYHFNAIVFSIGSRAQWNPPFIAERINDPAWAPVFMDKYVIIFLKRNQLNDSVIKKFEIDKKDLFGSYLST